MRILVVAALVEQGSTIGHIWGTTDGGTVMVHAAGDWRSVAAIAAAGEALGEPIPVEIEGWQILSVREMPEGPEG